MDEEYRSQLTEQLRALRRLDHEDQMTIAKAGLYVDPSVTIRAQDRRKEIARIESLLGIEQVSQQQRSYTPAPRQQFEAEITGRQERARQEDVRHQMNLLEINRRNLAHYRAQAKAFGGVDLAPPITRHGINEARANIAQVKRVLEGLGVAVETLPGDE